MFGQIVGSHNHTKKGYDKADCNVYAAQWLLFETILATVKTNKPEHKFVLYVNSQKLAKQTIIG